MGKTGKRNRSGGGGSSTRRSSSNGSTDGAAEKASAAAAGASGGSQTAAARILNPQAQRAANLGSTLIHIGLVWLVVGILVKLANNVRDAGGDPAVSAPLPPNGTLIGGTDKAGGGRAKLASAPGSTPPLATKNYRAFVTVDGFAVPRETLQSMGSYPDPFGITDETRRGFHPVVKFPEVWADDTADDVAAAVVDGDAVKSSRPESDTGESKGGRWRPPWDRKGLAKIRDYVIIDFQATAGASQLVDPARAEDVARERRVSGFRGEYGVGRYDEDRSRLYSSEMFKDESRGIDGYQGARTVHVGVDLGGPVGTKVYAFGDGVVHSAGYNPDLGDYGHVVVVEHTLPSVSLADAEQDISGENAGGSYSLGEEVGEKQKKKVWALYGHLDAKSVRGKIPGKHVRKGQVLGRIGDVHENGGWYYPHVHFQLSTEEPETHDMPGAVSLADRPRALIDYPDPRIVLGPLY